MALLRAGLTTAVVATVAWAAPAPAEVTIQFWSVGTSDDANMYRRMAEEFYRRTGVRVIVTPLGWGNFQSKYLTALAAGMPPDVGTTNLGGPFDYGSVGGLVDLAREFPEDIAALKEELFPGMWEGFTFRGHLFGIPHAITTLFLFYRKDVFDQLGLKPPATWSELDRVILALQARGYQYGYQWTREDAWAISSFTRPFGVDRYTADGTRATWDQPEFLAGVRWAVRFWNAYNMPVDKQAKPVELFVLDPSREGLLEPMFIDGSWRYFEIKNKAPELEGKWAIAPMPSADNGKAHSVYGGSAWVLFRKSQHKKEAMAWIRFVMSAEMQLETFRDNLLNRGDRCQLYLSPNKRMWEHPHLPLDAMTRNACVAVLAHMSSTEPVIGSVQADRELDLAFERIRNEASGFLADLCRKHGLSQWELKRAFARGRFGSDYRAFLAFLDQTTERVLKQLVPRVNDILLRERAQFERHYSNIMDEVAAAERAWDVLDWSKLIALTLVAGAILIIAARRDTRRKWVSYLYIAVPVLLLVVFLLIPILVSVYISFTNYNPVLPLASADWIGLDNFRRVLSSRELWQSLWRSFYYALLLLPVQLALGVVLAVGLDQALRPDRLFKFLYFSPLVTSVVSVALVWTALYLGAQYGWINALLLSLGLIRDPIVFLNDPHAFLNCVIVMSIWHGLAFVILINLAGLQNIPKELYEAAQIDGAGAVRRFFSVTVPSLRPQITFLVVMGTIGAVQVFEQIYILGGGSSEAGTKFGPSDSGMTMVPLIFRKGFEDFHMGEASAVAYVLFIVIFALTYLNWKVTTRHEQV